MEDTELYFDDLRLVFSQDGKYLYTCDDSECDEEVDVLVPEGVESIDSYIFDECENIRSISIPSSVTDIQEPLGYCENLSAINVSEDNAEYCSVDGVLFDKAMTRLIKYPERKEGKAYTVPASVTSLGEDGFGGCTDLESLTLPKGITELSEELFSSDGAPALKELHVMNACPDDIDFSCDDRNTLRGCTLFVPMGSGSDYRADERFSCFKEIKEEDSI